MRKILQDGIRYLKHKLVRGALILVYHRISESRLDPWSLSVSPNHFAEHLSVLRRSFHPLSLQELTQSIRSNASVVDKSVMITFDDGYADNLYAALPLLEQFDIPATVFIPTGAIGSERDFWWDELASFLLTTNPLPDRLDVRIGGQNHSWGIEGASLNDGTNESKYDSWRAGQTPPSSRHAVYLQLWQLISGLSVEEQENVMSTLRAWAGNPASVPLHHRIMDQAELGMLAQSTQVEIGAHTINHLPLASLSCESQRAEIWGSKAQLESFINRPIESFSYPFGKRKDYQPQTITLVQEAGFSVACCNESGVVSAKTDPFQLPRVHIHDCDGDEFERRLLSKFHA